MNKLAVIGNPIEHSLSPIIWQSFASSLGLNIEYTKILASPDNFFEVVRKFFANHGTALSVTAPFKAMAYQLATRHKQHTIDCKTGNLLINHGQDIIIDNTDGLGLIADIKQLNYDLVNKKVLFIGNGSVIHSVLSAIESEKPQLIHLLMRNYANLSQFSLRSSLVDRFNNEVDYDIVINTTPNSIENNLFIQIKNLADNALVYDMIYTATNTLYMDKMRQVNSSIHATNGIGMLIQQAKVAFLQVFGKNPDVTETYKLIQDKFK